MDQTFKNVVAMFHHHHVDRSSAIKEREGLGTGGHLAEEEGNDPLKGTSFWRHERASSCTKEALQWGSGRVLVAGDPTISNTESWVCQ